MKIQPILELKGIRIELSLEEAEKIARAPKDGAERIQNEVKLLIDLHHSDQDGAIIPSVQPGPHKRLDGSRPTQDPKTKRKLAPSPRVECEYCGGLYAKRGLVMHQRTCEAKFKVEDRRTVDSQADQDFDPSPASP